MSLKTVVAVSTSLLLGWSAVVAELGTRIKAPLSNHLVSTFVETKTVTQSIIVSSTQPAQSAGGTGKNGTCAGVAFDPDSYICHDDVLCPVINGEPMSACGRGCYSTFMYTCNGTHLHLLPEQQGQMALVASNPQKQDVDNVRVTTCAHEWRIGGITCSSCPEAILRACPKGDIMVVSGAHSMAVIVPGGQQFFLTEDWTVGVSTPHSARIPPGSDVAGFIGFLGGGFYYNVEDKNSLGWVACGKGPPFELRAVNSSSKRLLRDCVGVNLRVEVFDGIGAWQYN